MSRWGIRSRPGAWVTLTVGSSLWVAAPTSPAAAQDIEAVAAMRGIPLPAAYYDQVRANPDFYEFERALFRRVGGAGPGAVTGPALAPPRAPTSGSVRLPVVLALFSDSEVPHVSREAVQSALFSGPAPRGTIKEAYAEISRGALDVDGDVYGWVRTGLTLAEVVGSDRGFGPDERIGEYLVQALDSIDGSVDFSLYDNDGPDGVPDSGDDDGFVDVITFEFLEIAASCGGPAIWPHRTTLTNRVGEPYETDDIGAGGEPIRIQDYITQGATDCEGAAVQDAAVMTHEFGHALGLPDWYHWIDTSAGPYGRRWVLGCWALMAAGSWGCGPVTEQRTPFGPTHMIGFSKWYLGWVDPIVVGEVWNQEYVLDPMETTGAPLLIQLDGGGFEFLLAELRLPLGFDRHLPGAGVLLYKEDDNASLRPDPATEDPYFLTMLERDGDNTLLRTALEGGNRGEIGDAWGLGPGREALNATTTPQLRLSSGARTSVMVHEVRLDGDQARIVISTGRTPRLVEPTEPFEVVQILGFSLAVRIAGGVGPYQVLGALPDGVSAEASGDELRLVGSVRDAGPHRLELSVRDSGGRTSDPIAVSIVAPTVWDVTLGRLLQRFLASPDEPLSSEESGFLDDVGNRNGMYDVGDLRRWLRGGS